MPQIAVISIKVAKRWAKYFTGYALDVQRINKHIFGIIY